MRASAGLVRVLSQGVYETKAMLRNGEQLMLNIAFPVMALFGLRFTTFLDDYAAQLGTSRIQLAVPGVLTLCVISTALSGQGIATGFDRRYGVLRFLSTTPLGRNGLILGKLIAVAAVICIQFALVCAVSFGLGWQAEPYQLQRALTSMWVGGAAFTALGLLIAGTVRAEATLAIVNITWAILAAIGGVLVPVWAYAQPWQTIVTALPSGALGEALRADFFESSFSPWQHVLLIVWALVIGFAASRLFKWSD
ncbi:MAG: ABC transporter permease [Rothia sp. (in: high G+C Gram-positive bacteria)]|nr:ABC transporter permease [Rothia sp. (in: high G+C Gram-positive bacteria)]MDO5750722.1 ABC transporter permease [Rothia sp. (in: high G+C Gram-positive bacteria)]